jgi:hypothetical protein
LRENKMENWFQTWESENRLGFKDSGAEREATGTVLTETKSMPAQSARNRTLFSRSQWSEAGRRVTAIDSEAKRSIVVRTNGHTLYLFSLEQTAPRPSYKIK